MPLADSIRPKTLDEVVGQKHILGEGKPLRRIIESGKIPNMIFYGSSGIGKTTVANIIANRSGKKLYHLNATTAGISDIKEIISSLDTIEGMGGVLLYLHGGGFAFGDLDYAKGFGSMLAVQTGTRVFCPDYRLAPENPYVSSSHRPRVAIYSDGNLVAMECISEEKTYRINKARTKKSWKQ